MICKTCLIDKDLEQFLVVQGYRRKQCKSCRAEYERNWKLANHEHKKAHDREYYQLNKEEIRKKTKERIKLTGYKSTEDVKRWRKNNPERHSIISKNYKSRRRAVEKTGKVTPQEWQNQLDTFNNHCAYCLKPLEKAEMEHMKPLSRGGEHSIDNIVPSCPSCNRLKSTKTLLEFARTCCAA